MKETEKLSVLFLLKSAKKNADGKIPVTVRITVKGTKPIGLQERQRKQL